VESNTLTLQLPAGKLEVATASLGVTFSYSNGDPEHYALVPAAIAGDTLSFDFSPYGGSLISYLSGEPSIESSCGDDVRVQAPGSGFGPAIMVEVEGSGGQAGAANDPGTEIACGKTN
jgi:hypothetical protein